MATGQPTGVFGSIARWWHNRTAGRANLDRMAQCPPDEATAIARDLGLTLPELQALVRRGTGDVELLLRRLEILGLDAAELARSESATFRDLQKLCTLCEDRVRCARDMAAHAGDAAWDGWHEYCPNTATLKMLAALRCCTERSAAGDATDASRG